MYAVIATGGKQERVAEGQQVQVELLGVDDGQILATPSQLEGAIVSARIVGRAKGPKINGFTYKSKTNQRRRYGHRQHYTVIEITSITKG